MGLFSDDLDYRDPDALCFRLKRTVEGTTIELPLNVEARISYVTWNNAKEVTIDGATVKELKKSDRLLGAMKPIFEKYVTEEISANPEYAEKIFPNEFFGEPQLEFSEKQANELINSNLFKNALSKINDPDGFEDVKFETVYAIAPVGFKIWTVTSGVSIPYDYSDLVKETNETEASEVSVQKLAEIISEPTVPNETGVDEPVNDIPDAEEEKHSGLDEIHKFHKEILALETKCVQLQEKNQSSKERLENVLRSVASLEEQLKQDEAFVAQHGFIQEELANCSREIDECKKRMAELRLEEEEKQMQLDNLKAHKIDLSSSLLYSVIQHINSHLL